MEKLFLPALTENLNRVVGFVDQVAEQAGISSDVWPIQLSVEEIFVNIANYAYGKGQGDVVIYCGFQAKDEETGVFVVEFHDQGIAFNPLLTPKPNLDLPLEMREPGGLGVFLAEKYMDEVKYCREDGENILLLKKKVLIEKIEAEIF